VRRSDGLAFLLFDGHLVFDIFCQHLTVFVHFGELAIENFHLFIQVLEPHIGLLQAAGPPGFQDNDGLILAVFGLAGQLEIVFDLPLIVDNQFFEFVHLPTQLANLLIHFAQVAFQFFDIALEYANGVYLDEKTCNVAHNAFVHVANEGAEFGVKRYIGSDGHNRQRAGQVECIGKDSFPIDRSDDIHTQSSQGCQKDQARDALGPLPK